MRSQAIVYRTVVVLAVMAVTACATGPTGEVAQTRSTNKIIDAYKIPDLMAQAGPAVTESLHKNLPDAIDAAAVERVDNKIKQVYAPAELRQAVVRRFKTHAVQTHHEAAVASAAATLDKPLVQRMLDLEGQVSDPNFGQGFNEFAQQKVTAERKKRIRLIRSLAADKRVVALQTDFNVALLGAMIHARNAAVGPAQQASEKQIQRLLKKARSGIRGKLNKQVPLMLLYVYRDIDTSTLRQYAQIQSQADMVWVNEALEGAITTTLENAGQQLAPESTDTRA